MHGQRDATDPHPLVVARDLDALEAHADAWDRLALAPPAPAAVPFSSHAWTASYLEEKVGAGTPWRCYLAYEGDALVGVLPLIEKPHRLLGGLRPWLRVPPDFYTHEGNLLLDPDRADTAAALLLDGVAQHEDGFTGIRLGSIRDESGAVNALRAAGRGTLLAGHDVDGRLVRVEGSWADYLDRLGRNFRRNLKKARNRAAKAGWTWRRLAGKDADPAHIDAFLALEASGWKGAWGDAVARTEDAMAFYRRVVKRLAARGWLEWHLLESDGRWIAAHLGVRFGRSLVLVRIAYDEAEKRLAPGNLLLGHLIEDEFERGDTDWIDCITDMPWHDNWAMERRGYASALWFPPGPLPYLFGVAPARLRVRLAKSRWLKRLRGRLGKPAVDARAQASGRPVPNT